MYEPFTPQFGAPGTQFPSNPYSGISAPQMMPTQPGPYARFQPQPQPQPQAFDWIRVNTLDDVKNVTVQPGQKAWIMLQNDPIFVVKSANEMGLAHTEAFRFEPYTPDQTAAHVEYAPMETVQHLQMAVNQMAEELNAIKGGMSRGKSAKQPTATAE